LLKAIIPEDFDVLGNFYRCKSIGLCINGNPGILLCTVYIEVYVLISATGFLKFEEPAGGC